MESLKYRGDRMRYEEVENTENTLLPSHAPSSLLSSPLSLFTCSYVITICLHLYICISTLGGWLSSLEFPIGCDVQVDQCVWLAADRRQRLWTRRLRSRRNQRLWMRAPAHVSGQALGPAPVVQAREQLVVKAGDGVVDGHAGRVC